MKIIRIFTKLENGKRCQTDFEVFPGDRIELRETYDVKKGEDWVGATVHAGKATKLLLTIHP